MELILTASSATQASVTCDNQPSHTFDPRPLILPNDEDGHPVPPANPIMYGQAVFAALFPPNTSVRKAFDDQPERIVLVADAALQAIAWEYAHDATFFIVTEIPFVRGLPKDQRISTPILSEGLHILAVPSSPLGKGISPLNIEGEWLPLTEIVDELEAAITLERVRPPTLDRLGELATEQHDLVVHFMGHGGSADGAILLFEQENGAIKLTTARDFANTIRRKAFFVTLNACASAVPGATEFDNLAAALVAQGVPYALGMRFSIEDDDARDISRTLYGLLARGESVEKALVMARHKLTDSPRKWAVGVPVLYTALDQPSDGFRHIDGVSVIRENQPKIDLFAISYSESTFQGRVDELVVLGTALTGDNRPRALAIHALGGQGKTALAREAVERFGWAWPGGVWAISLENLPTRVAFVAALARFLNLDPATIADPIELETAVLARLNRRTLLILDNMETLVQAVNRQDTEAIRLARFLRENLNGTRAHLLMTSREVLGWPGEEVLDLGGLNDREGSRLFYEHASNRHAVLSMHEVDHLSRSVEGHPLSLQLLSGAFNFADMTFHEFVKAYELVLLEAENKYKELDHRQRSLHAVIDTSVRALPADLRDLLSSLWIFHAPFLPQTADAIFDSEDKQVHDRLHQLWERGLLVRQKMTGRDGTVLLYRLLPTVRLYAQQMPQIQDQAALLARLGMEYAILANQLYRGIDRGGSLTLIAQQIAEDLTRGLEFIEPESEEYGYYLLHRGWIAQRLGDRQTGLRVTERALENAQGHYPRLELEVLNNLGGVYRAIGQPSKGRELYEQARLIAHKLGDRAGEATTLNNLALIHSYTGQPHKARELYEQALPILREVHDRAGEAAVLTNLAAIFCDTGQRQKARRLYELGLPILRELRDRAGEAATLSNLAMVYSMDGELQKARELYEQALPIRREVGERAGEAATLDNLASVYSMLGELQKARKLHGQALSIVREVNDRVGEAGILNNLGFLHFQIGEPELSLEYLQKSAYIYHEVDAIGYEAAILFNTAVVLHEQLNRTAEAVAYVQRSIALLKQYDLPQDASGATLAHHEQLLSQLHGHGHK